MARTQSSITVHLVNLTNPMRMKGPLREVLPIPSQEVRLRLPGEQRVANVRLLVAGTTAQAMRDGNFLEVHVPTAGIHEVIAFDFS